MMPAPMLGGGLSEEPLSSTHASKWLRELLVSRGADAEVVKGISTHSLKCTLLSWSAKYGLDRETRQILGYHMVPGSRSALHYSRDEQAAPLRRLRQVVVEVARGDFNPDAGRSGMFKRMVPQHHPTALAEDSRSDSSSSESSCSSDDTDVEESLTVPARKPAFEPMSDEQVYVRHQRLQTVHRVRRGDLTRLACAPWIGQGVEHASATWGQQGSDAQLACQPFPPGELCPSECWKVAVRRDPCIMHAVAMA
eukprot:4756925-Amphidinium_carterae.1